MPTRRSRPKKIKKVVEKLANGVGAAQSELAIHTIENPSTTKRFIVDFDLGQDEATTVDDDDYSWGICITNPGETIPSLSNIESEEARWLVYGAGLARDQGVNGTPVHVYRDLKIQRKVKDGEVITFVAEQTRDGFVAGSITVFIDET